MSTDNEWTPGTLYWYEDEIARLRERYEAQLDQLYDANMKLRGAFDEIASHWDGYVLKDLSAADVMAIVDKALNPERQ